MNKKKKTSKISLICNEQKIPLSVEIFKSSIHDVNTINNTIKNLPLDQNASFFKRCNLI